MDLQKSAKSERGVQQRTLKTLSEAAQSQANAEGSPGVIILPVRKQSRAGINQEESYVVDAKKISSETYRLVGDEVLNRNFDPGCWARALSEGDGTEESALSAYARLRAESLAEEYEEQKTKGAAFEKRKLFAGANSPAEPPTESPVRVRKRKRYTVLDFVYWQGLLSLSGVGLFLVAKATMAAPGEGWWPGWLSVVSLSAVLQLLPLIGFVLLRFFRKEAELQFSSKITALAVVAISMLFTVQAFLGKPVVKKIVGLFPGDSVKTEVVSTSSAR